MIRLSIIIPIYNVDEYINRCIESILTQNVSSDLYEIIMINDGSTDNSKLIIEDLTRNNPNIDSLTIDNSGVSVARNTGLSHARGKLVMFVDPDDVLCKGCLKKIIALDADNFNFIIGRSYQKNKEIYTWSKLYRDGEYAIPIDTINKGYVRGSVCGCVFSKKFLVTKKILFPKGIRNSEDTIFLFNCLINSEFIVFKDIDIYDVIGRPASASKVYNKERIDRLYTTIEYVNKQLKNSNILNQSQINILGFLKYLLLSNFTNTLILTKNYRLFKAYNKLKKYNIKIFCPMIKYKKGKIAVLNLSYLLFYYLCLTFNSLQNYSYKLKRLTSKH